MNTFFGHGLMVNVCEVEVYIFSVIASPKNIKFGRWRCGVFGNNNVRVR